MEDADSLPGLWLGKPQGQEKTKNQKKSFEVRDV